MPTRSHSVVLGPFNGGMNTAVDPASIADNELVDCVNFDVDLDGSLRQRPPLLEVATQANQHLYVIGHAYISGTTYIVFGTDTNGVYVWTPSGGFTTISATMKAKVALQYRDAIYIVAKQNSPVDGGYWKPVGGFTAQAAMPRGESAIFNKARMFIVPGPGSTTNTSRLSFSDPITADVFTWPATNIIDVSPGDGQQLLDLAILNDNLILFKRNSTYVLAYDLQIADAVLRNVNPNIGVMDLYCVVPFETSLYILHNGNVYEIANYDFTRLNTKFPFAVDQTSPVGSTRVDQTFVTLLGERLVVRFYNNVYVYGLRTKTWVRWASANNILTNFGVFVLDFQYQATNGIPRYFAGSCLAGAALSKSVIEFFDGFFSTGSVYESDIAGNHVTITSSILTKNYDFSEPKLFKKLMWWGADVFTTKNVVSICTPVVNSFKVTWNQLSTYTWNQLSANTWAQPLSNSVGQETDVTMLNTMPRVFIKFKKALRFRQVNFKVILIGDGSEASGPARLFSLTAIVNTKQLVSKQVS